MLKKIKDWWFGLWNKAELMYLDLAAEVEERVQRTERLMQVLTNSWSARIRDAEMELEKLREELRKLKEKLG